jgi:hypothetical protein
MNVKLRTLQSWGIDWPNGRGRPRVADEEASPRTARRRRQENAVPGYLAEV